MIVCHDTGVNQADKAMCGLNGKRSSPLLQIGCISRNVGQLWAARPITHPLQALHG